MITRIWHGKTKHAQADKYLQFLLGDGTKEYRETTGNLAVRVLQKKEDDYCHFWTVTDWTDLEAIKNFAGEDAEKAKYYPADHEILLEFEEKVNHYDCYNVSNAKIKSHVLQLEQLFNGGSWQGENFSDKLEIVDEDAAFTAPVPGVHCIAEIVWHCIYWRTTLIRRMEGDINYRDSTVDRFNFLPIDVLKKKGWEALKEELNQSQQKLVGLLQIRSDRFLQEEFKQGYTNDYLVEGIIHHDIYHLGQIGLVKKIIDQKLV